MKKTKIKMNIKQIIFNSFLTLAILISSGTMVFASSTSTPFAYEGITAYGVLDVNWLSNGGSGYAQTYTNDYTTYSLGVYLTVHNASGTALNGDSAVGFDSVQTNVLTERNATEYRSLHNIQESRVPQAQTKLVSKK
ncbi:MAG: hypothetical protein ACI4GD_11300 [Lachnospiraceae bacterium]